MTPKQIISEKCDHDWITIKVVAPPGMEAANETTTHCKLCGKRLLHIDGRLVEMAMSGTSIMSDALRRRN